MFRRPPQLDARGEYTHYAEHRGGKHKAVLLALLKLHDSHEHHTGLAFFTAEQILAQVDQVEREHILHGHGPEKVDRILKDIVDHYLAQMSVYFTTNPTYYEPAYQDVPGDETDRLRFTLHIVAVRSKIAAELPFLPPDHVTYDATTLKERKFRTLDNFALMGRIYVFAGLSLLDLAILVIIGVSAKLLSVALLVPAAYSLFYLARESIFLVQRIQLLGNAYSTRNIVKVMLYNADRSFMVVRRQEIKATCPICAGRLNLSKSQSVYNGRIVGRCDRDFLEHVFSFDHQTFRGTLLTCR